MSANDILFGLLGAPGGVPWVPPAASSSPPVGKSSLIPDSYDAVIAQIRPDFGDEAIIVQVGADKRFARVNDAITYGNNLRAVSSSTPWVVVVIDRGVYSDEGGRIPLKKTALISAAGQPRSVTIKAGLEYAVAPYYVEGLIMDAVDSTNAKYGIHAGIESACGVLAGCTLTHSASTLGSSWPMGTDGGSSGYSLLYDVELRGGSNSRTNNHGGIGGSQLAPFKQVYVKVQSNGGIQYDGLGNDQPDELWVIDSQAAWAGIANSASGAYFATESRPALGAGVYASKMPVVVGSDAWPRPVWG
ncbi:hypothetical protein [Rothia nasimurium]|uniref:hypothetical protein n=1 Tax=Rothia nasimurium TaxID=85336 RepID=UPI001F41D1D0|nr:hypothetical protein [Rothia nasimurium]